MHDLLRAALIAGGVLIVTACGGSGGDEAATNTIDANLMFEEPANDQSALESAANVTDVAPVTNEEAENATEDEAGNDTVESNVTGM